jgi:hypothetical protein
MKDFDEAFSNYLETYEADELFNNYFSAIRKAFIAGYKAAGGEEPRKKPLLKLINYARDHNKHHQR